MEKLIRTPKNLEKLIWDELLREFNKAKSLKEIDRLFDILTTAQERETIARRLATLSLIRKGLSYKEISRRLWVSPITISRIKKSIISNWFDHIAFLIENAPQKNGPRWRFLNYGKK